VRKIKTKTAIIGSTNVLGLGGATFGLALPFAANAASPNASGYCGASTNGCVQSGALEEGNCAGHGAFGAFGTYGDVGIHDWSGGASGDHTAYNNSTLCGSPSPNSAAAVEGDTPNQ
jgi:hypothetical protein